ncbi:dipeptidase PepE [Alteromonas pelagimontana]|uniref:Dipeptidase PepE n=1 Tax=Alteromonas pelagimontana TaxID=1858656 RepID=A0A6M4M9J8_9ALTE|nr:dipeptidase PepE [Alteromonas pelagimontana]QJR79797.1 dipeptidase PepE [Alteromonas pelagimontana]
MTAHVLMLSSSRQGTEDYLAHAKPHILTHLGKRRELLFMPYAGVTTSWDDYVGAVQSALPECQVKGIHQFTDPAAAVAQADANGQTIVVGGGNTFHLLNTLYQNNLISPIQQAIDCGTPYIGWSAGANICGATIRTTNDMPIIEPPSFNALGILPCQLNPHYTDYQPPNHNGESRDQRLAEFTTLHPDIPVLAIREGTALRLSSGQMTLLGDKDGVVFKGTTRTILRVGEDLSKYLA